VVVNAPSNNVYYGNLVAGPIFKEIADKVYATSLDMHKELEAQPLAQGRLKLPIARHGNREDLLEVYENLGIPYLLNDDSGFWLHIQTRSDKVLASTRKIQKGIIPNVLGMDIKDAVYIMENMGLDVEIEGFGFIKTQEPLPGSPIKDVQRVKLKLEA
jgi:cell division protein FtsI (penicillin-binding protein 3)